MRVKCLAQEHNAVPRPGLEPGQNSSEYPDNLSVLSRAFWCFLPTTFLEIAVNKEHKPTLRCAQAQFASIYSIIYKTPKICPISTAKHKPMKIVLQNSSTRSVIPRSSSASVANLQTMVFSFWDSSHIHSHDKELDTTGKYNKLPVHNDTDK